MNSFNFSKTKAVLFFLILQGALLADSQESQNPSNTLSEMICCYVFHPSRDPHYIYLAPGIFGLSINTTVKNFQTSGQKFLEFWQIGYEYLKPSSFYAGINFSLGQAVGSIQTTHNQNSFSSTKNPGFWNGDLRLGYTLPKANLFISPFLSLGFYGLIPSYFYQSDGGLRQTSFYLGGGLQILYPVFSSFDVAIDIEFFGDLISKISYDNLGMKYSLSRSNGGAKAAFPLIWHLGEDKRFDIRLQPYLFTLSWSDLELFYGASLIAGYHF